jgi:hypothetical protein
MTQTKFFIIFSAVIFVLERIFQPLFSFPIFIFPLFVIFFGLSAAGDMVKYLPCVAIAALFFDFFSGLPFGWMTIAILIVFLTMYLARIFLDITGRPLIFTTAFYLVFVFEYFFLLSIRISPRFVISQTLFILAESIILLVLLKFLFRKLLLKAPNP